MTNQMLLMIVILASMSYVSYSCYLIKTKKYEITESQERRVAKYILLVIFFVLAMIYQNARDSSLFTALWFSYALYLVVGDTKRTLTGQNRRKTDPCFQC